MYQPCPHLLLVLIETLWNVKWIVAVASDQELFVLIETLWNVKAL